MKKLLYSLCLLGATIAATSCDGEKEMIIIEGELPIKTSVLYMMGDATPTGWDKDNPTSFSAEGEDPLVFTWRGTLNTGEIKLCIIPGSWDVPFIRPLADQTEISSNNIVDAKFQMHAGDPDEKWRVTEAGDYLLEFDLRHWCMSTTYLNAAAAPSKDPIVTENLYIVGDATPNGWNIDSPTILSKTSDYIFEFEGELTAGEMKACTEVGSWDVAFVRPETDGVEINRNGVANSEFMYVANPDNKWHVIDPGLYHLTFDLQDYTISAQFLGEVETDKSPIETETLYIIGDATPGGWSMDDATPLTLSATERNVFTWSGFLNKGEMKACLEPDSTFSCPFIRPAFGGCVIDENGVQSPDFVYTTNPDDKWQIEKAGNYMLIFDLNNWSLNVEYLD